jgi:hypothetical protein
MDPLSISAACVGVASGAATLSTQIFRFAAQVRASRKDMDAVSREVSSLQMCLETLRDDAVAINYPPRIRQNIYEILKNCEAKINEMVVLLGTVEARNLGRGLQWTVMYRDQMNAMRVSLEVYKSSLEIALELGSTLLISAVQDTTDATRRDVTFIRRDMVQVTQLLAGTRALRAQFHRLEEQGVGISIPLQRFLDETETYAESVRGPDDLSEVVWEEPPVTANARRDAGAATPFTGSDNGRSALIVPGSTVPLVPNDDVSRHTSGKFASFIYVVPLLQADVDRCLATRNNLSASERARLDAELKTAASDNSRQPLAVIKALVEKGADGAMALCNELETKLYPRHNVVFYLISMGSTVNLNVQIGHHRNCADIFRFLLHQKLCNFEAVNSPGDENVLHTAMGHGTRQIENGGSVPVSPEAIEVLCEHGADVNHGSKDGDTPLHTALHVTRGGRGISEHSDFVRVLLEWGAGPLVVGQFDLTALKLAGRLADDHGPFICRDKLGPEIWLGNMPVAKSRRKTRTTPEDRVLVASHLFRRR